MNTYPVRINCLHTRASCLASWSKSDGDWVKQHRTREKDKATIFQAWLGEGSDRTWSVIVALP